MQIELLLLVISILFFASILVSKASSKLGVPVLLLFLIVGMLFGTDGLGIQFDSIHTAHMIGTVALCIILFSGGMDTKIDDIKQHAMMFRIECIPAYTDQGFDHIMLPFLLKRTKHH